MNGTHAQVATQHTTTETAGILGGSALEGFGGIATIALAIVGLTGIFSPTMAAIATIVVGAATLVEGGAFGLRRTASGASTATSLFQGATAFDFQGGLATVVLGILALLGVAPQTLISVAVLALGTTFLFSNRILIGLAAIVLGILAVVGLSSFTLSLVGLLILGAGLVFGGSENAVSAWSTRSSANM